MNKNDAPKGYVAVEWTDCIDCDLFGKGRCGRRGETPSCFGDSRTDRTAAMFKRKRKPVRKPHRCQTLGELEQKAWRGMDEKPEAAG